MPPSGKGTTDATKAPVTRWRGKTAIKATKQ